LAASHPNLGVVSTRREVTVPRVRAEATGVVAKEEQK